MQKYEVMISYFLLLVLGCAILIVAWGYPAGSSYFPIFVGLAIVVLSAIGLTGINREPSESSSDDDDAPLPRAVIGLGMFAAYLLAANYLGFLTAALVFVPALAVYGFVRNPLALFGCSVGFVIVLHVVFIEVFSRPLPPDLIFGLLR